ncbi:MAG: DUF58 domain-containing protein [Proteobacteria bacterium]|nr:DUF58 domain-containing protein [Pseudomonadota bacterium]
MPSATLPLASTLRRTVRPLLDRWLFRLARPEPSPILLHQRRIYVLPTSAGLGLAAALLAMLIASINYSLSLGYGLTFLIAGIGVASIIHAFRNLFCLSVSAGRCEPAFCGESARFVFQVANLRSSRRPALRLRARGGETAFDLAAADVTSVELACLATRRGWLRAGRTTLETTWPLGLIRAWSVFIPDLACIVYPQPEPTPPPLPLGAAEGGNGRRLANTGDEDFHGLRPYRDSDSPRHVAWKALARGAPLLTKQYAGQRGEDVVLDWHTLPATLGDEERLSRLAAWLLAAERAGHRYGLELPSARIDAGHGEPHLHRCLRALALYRTTDTPLAGSTQDAR